MNRPEINVTPLIDVLLVLLIIFMIVTPTKPSSLEAKIPQEPVNDGAESPPLALVVTVEKNGELRLNTESLGATVADPEPLTERLRKVFAERETNRAYSQNTDAGNPKIEKTVFIKAPTALDYGSVAKVVDTVKLSGASPVGLQLDDLDQNY
jgi:biopolymer transport protein ExbD